MEVCTIPVRVLGFKCDLFQLFCPIRPTLGFNLWPNLMPNFSCVLSLALSALSSLFTVIQKNVDLGGLNWSSFFVGASQLTVSGPLR